jgi:hypothetical protein
VKKIIAITCLLILSACQPTIKETPIPTTTQQPIEATPTSEPQITFPPGINPLTGLPVADPALFNIPALLVSISNFPAIGRPQAGLSFAPFVYEYYITEGATRFLAVFYGTFPSEEILPTGGCKIRNGPFIKTQTILGDRVWFDTNSNGMLDINEEGLPGVCVNLYDSQGNLLQQTTTDTNGYFGFNVQPGEYTVEFVRPHGMQFTGQHLGDPNHDSDADPSTGRAQIEVTSDVLNLDAGLTSKANLLPPSNASTNPPLPQIGPIRSGRLIYSYIGNYFQNSCLIYAFASPEEQVRIPQCYMVFHQLAGGGYMLDISEMLKVAQKNQKEKGSTFDYTSNLYSDLPPSGGKPASILNVYIAYQNQSGWTYDPLYQAYLRSVDTSDYNQAGVLHADIDRLTGRQLHFENIIILSAEHEVISPTNLDIHLDPGLTGSALLIRDGQMFNIQWSTVPTKTEENTGVQHPIRFLNMDNTPAPLKPGHTWILVVTPNSSIVEKSPSVWTLNFSQPPGAK